ncbi:hypothetical protein ACFFWB_27210 [Flavobacterium procerum]
MQAYRLEMGTKMPVWRIEKLA